MRFVVNFGLGCVVVYASLFGLGALLERPWGLGVVAVAAILALLGAAIWRLSRARRYGAQGPYNSATEASLAFQNRDTGGPLQ